MPKGRLVFDGDNIYTEKDARIYKLKTSVSSKIDAIPWVVDSLDSTSTTDALSANMGRTLQDQINSLSWTWKFLSTWDCTTWLPGTNPQEDPYTYKVWDYYVVSTVGSTNYKPHWGTFTQWVPSTTVELENVWTNDKYYFDGADWVRIPDTAIQISIDSALSTTSTNAVENRAIANAINTKQDIISDLNTIRSWAAAGSTALQRLDNITELTNNAGYQTAWDVTNIVNNAISTLAPDWVWTWVLTLQKNATTVDTFSANATQNKTINITVPTTVAELSDASDYATKADVAWDLADYVQTSDLWAVATSNDYNDLDNKPTIPTVNNAALVIQKNGTNVATFTANAAAAVTANISVPTTVAELSDASDYETNTKTFYLSSYTDYTTATAAYNWRLAWKNAIIYHNGTFYDVYSPSADITSVATWETSYVTAGMSGSQSNTQSNWFRNNITFWITNWSVTSISSSVTNINGSYFLSTMVNYSTPYTPQYPGSPATKKYVDDAVSGQQGITNNTTWTTSTISQEWVGTKAEFEALSSYWNIIYNIIE